MLKFCKFNILKHNCNGYGLVVIIFLLKFKFKIPTYPQGHRIRLHTKIVHENNVIKLPLYTGLMSVCDGWLH